jgi:uncharacterized protein YndB with AHSA1/START domain
MRTIIHTVEIAAGREDVHRLLTTIEGVAGWWTRQADGDAGAGGVIGFRFRGDFNPDMRVEEASPERVRWTCVAGHANWADNTFTFDLRGAGPVSLRFTQDYAQELDDDVYGTYNFNWGYYLESLRLLAETGAGRPFGAA